MAIYLVATEIAESAVIYFSGLNDLEATESLDTANFYSGGVLAATEVAEEALFTFVFQPISLEAVESQDTGLVNILQGEVVELEAVELQDTASFSGSTQILVQISVTEQLDLASFHTLTGKLITFGAVEITDTASITFSGNTLLTLEATESAEYASFFISSVGSASTVYIRKAIVMHLMNHAVSEYKNFNFNSLVQFNGVFLGINEQGVYILDGNDDLGQLIQARIKSGIEDLGKGAISIPREAWLAYRSDYGMQLDVRMNEDEDEDLPTTTFGKITRGIGEWKEKLGRGIKARFFTWDLKNIDGSDFSLESLRILGDVIKRKRR